ncbi:ubiquitin-like domain-containing protein, partial [Salmonella sp. s51228]|uniref:ubiquitin-like domain-containing protein n=1 Tax=Salmonella sp. s51228 TaxID=3159652 RepID=UPI00397EACE3
MRLFVYTLFGRTLCLSTFANCTIVDLKSKIEKECEIPSSFQKLFFCGRELDDMYTISEISLCNGNTIFLDLGINGGAKKRKKK